MNKKTATSITIFSFESRNYNICFKKNYAVLKSAIVGEFLKFQVESAYVCGIRFQFGVIHLLCGIRWQFVESWKNRSFYILKHV